MGYNTGLGLAWTRLLKQPGRCDSYGLAACVLARLWRGKMELLSVSAALIQNRPLEKAEGTACPAPYLDVGLSALVSREMREVRFLARVDTGADITCVPLALARGLMPLLMGRPVLIRGHDGSVARARTYLVTVRIYGYPDPDEVRVYKPHRGVLLTDSDTGLIGMDIIREWDLSLKRSGCAFSVVCL